MSAPVVLVVGAGGGAGATLVAGALALAWSTAGTPAWLVELDLENGDLAGAWGLSGDRTLGDLVAVAGELEEAHLRQAGQSHSPGLRVLVAPAASGAASPWGPEAVARLVEVVRGEGRVSLDGGGGLSPVALAAAARADRILVVCRASVAAARRAGRLVATLSASGLGARAGLVVADGPGRVEIGARALARVVGVDLVAEIPWDARQAGRIGGGRWPSGRRRGLGASLERLAEAL